jgi:tryptophanyl-tRNA synthetase
LGNHIGLLDEPEEIWNSLRPALTDPARVTKKDPGTPEKCNVYDLHQQFSPLPVVDEVAEKCRTAGWGCIDCKRVLAENMAETFAPMRARAAELRAAPDRVREVLALGAAKAREVANDTMEGVRTRMGLMPATST